jgi:hypothetical protein
MFSSDWSSLVSLLGTAISSAIIVATGAWWLSGQFSKVRHLVDDKINRLEDNLIKKMEYHEQHDDNRFTQVRNDIWHIRLENAAKTGKVAVVTTDELSSTN